MKDYYKILNVSKDASEQEIKKAYKARALETHPDRNPGDANAESKFKEISEAYTILSDKEKRRRYDMGGMSSGPGPGFDPFTHFDFGGHGGFDDFLQGFFRHHRSTGGQRAAPKNIPGPDIRTFVSLSLEEVLSGISKSVSVERELRCNTCEGSGAQTDADSIQTCHYCGGAGRVVGGQGMIQIMSMCGLCNGTGKIIKKPCKECQGNRTKTSRETVSVKIPPGVQYGNVLRIQGKGDESNQKGGPPGNLLVEIIVNDHPIFERSDDDLFTELKLPFPVAVMGGEITVPILGTKPGEKKTITLTLSERGITETSELRINNLGLPNLRTGQRGEQIVHLTVDIPTSDRLSKKQKELLRQFMETGNDSQGEIETKN